MSRSGGETLKTLALTPPYAQILLHPHFNHLPAENVANISYTVALVHILSEFHGLYRSWVREPALESGWSELTGISLNTCRNMHYIYTLFILIVFGCASCGGQSSASGTSTEERVGALLNETHAPAQQAVKDSPAERKAPYGVQRATITCSSKWKCYRYKNWVNITLKPRWTYFVGSYAACCKKCVNKDGCWSFTFGKSQSNANTCWMYNRIPEYGDFESFYGYRSGYVDCA